MFRVLPASAVFPAQFQLNRKQEKLIHIFTVKVRTVETHRGIKLKIISKTQFFNPLIGAMKNSLLSQRYQNISISL